VSGDVRSAAIAAYKEAIRRKPDLARPSTFTVFKASQNFQPLENVYP
jgi:hypothetical protein